MTNDYFFFKIHQDFQKEKKVLTKCIWCENEPIKIKKTFLGTKCYNLYRNYGTPETKYKPIKKAYIPVPNDITYRRGKTIKTLIYKHGAKILADFIALSNKPYYSLSDFANKYNFTREYARQIHLRLIGKPFQETAHKKTKLVNSVDIACKNNPLYKIAEHKKSSKTRQGALIEQKFIEECEKRNLNIEIPCGTAIDLKINGFNVEVKSNGKSRVTIGAITPRYLFFIRESQFKKADFFACYHNRLKTFFIIPKKEVNQNRGGSAGISFLAEKSNYKCAKNRYWEFKDAWHLLR